MGFLSVSITKSVDERRAKHYAEIREEAARQVKIKKIQDRMVFVWRMRCLIPRERGKIWFLK